MESETAPSRREPPDVRLAIFLTLLVASVLLAVWVWSKICGFPLLAWNDMRLAPTIAFAQGIPIYPTGTHGTINTWTYGPLPVLYYWPAAWASSAGGALMVGAILNATLTIVPLALICFKWPGWNPQTDKWHLRAIAFVLCFAVWPARHYELLFADNLAIACGLLGNLVLVRASSSPMLWVAAVAAAAAIACKQTALGIPVAQVMWVGLVTGPKAGLVHCARCAIAGMLIGVLALVPFGGAGLWFVLIELPLRFPWDYFSPRLLSALPEAAVQIGIPLGTMVTCRTAFARPTLLLPAVAWFCALPLGIMALLKTGGWHNSWHSLVFWLPPVLVALFTAAWPSRIRQLVHLAGAFTAASVTCLRVIGATSLPLQPQISHYSEAERIAGRFRGQIWFPVHPTITLYSDRQYYHDEDGIFVRRVAARGITSDQMIAHLPAKLDSMAFHTKWRDWGIARNMLPPDASLRVIGSWALYSSPAPRPSP